MKLTYDEIKQNLENAKEERLLEIVDSFFNKKEQLKFCIKLLLGRTDIENIQMTSLKTAISKIEKDFSRDQDVIYFLEKTMAAIKYYQKQLWSHQKTEGKEEIVYQTSEKNNDSFEDIVSKNLEEYSRKVTEEEKKKQQIIALKKRQANYVQALEKLAQDLKEFEDRIQSYFEKSENMDTRKVLKVCRHLQEEFDCYQKRNLQLNTQYDEIMKENQELKQNTDSFQKELERFQFKVHYELPRVEHLLDGLALKAKESSNAKKKEKETIHAKRALQEALDRYDIKMNVIKRYLKEFDQALSKYTQKDQNALMNIEKVSKELDTRFSVIFDNLNDVIKYYQKLSIDATDYQKLEQEKIKKYQELYLMMQQEFETKKSCISTPEKKNIQEERNVNIKSEASAKKHDTSKTELKAELSKKLDQYAEKIDVFETNLNAFSKKVKSYKEQAQTYSLKHIVNIKKKLQNTFDVCKIQLLELEQKYQEILKAFSALELDAKEFEKQNIKAMTPIKEKFAEVEKECNDFGINIAQTSSKDNVEKQKEQKELSESKLICKDLTLMTMLRCALTDFADFCFTLDYYEQKMASYNEKKYQKIKEKIQKLYNQYQLEMIDLKQKYQEVFEEYSKKGLSMEKFGKYQETMNKVQANYDKMEALCQRLNLDPVQITEKALDNRKAKKKELANVKSYLLSLKKLAPWALGGAVVGLGASVVIPSVTITGLGGIRIAYSLAKFGNKAISKKFLNGEPTPIDNIVDIGKSFVKASGVRYFGENKIYRSIREGVRNINRFLKNPKVQSVITGLSIGYVAGNIMNLNEKVDKLLQNSHPQPEKGAVVSNLRETIETETKKVFEQPAVPETPIETPEVPNYGWIKTGQTIDLTGIQEGYTNVYDAIANNNAVSLINELASQENGTFIEQFVLPNGEKFFGNMDALIEKCEKLGVKLENVGALISNQNGYYGYTTGEEIIEHALELSRSL